MPDDTPPRTIDLPRCAYCPEYASDTIPLPRGHILYVCEEHYDAWLAAQTDNND